MAVNRFYSDTNYTEIRAHHGLAWFPLIDSSGKIRWEANPNYLSSTLRSGRAREYTELGLVSETPIYSHLCSNPRAIQWVSDPASMGSLWQHFEP